MAREAQTKSGLKRELQQRQIGWLREVINATGKSASQIATESGVSDTTLTRLLNNPEYQGTLSQLTIDRIKGTYQVPGPEDLGKKRNVLGFAEAERLDPADAPPMLARILKELLAAHPGAAAWRLKTSALEAAGYLAGDVVVVDPNHAPHPHDAVCAQVYDFKGGGAETVWRVFMPPYLVGAAHDRTAYKPLLLDNDRVILKGVLIASVRPHGLASLR